MSPKTASDIGARAAAAARGWLGTPYCHQASRRGVGADCLGLVRGVWRQLYACEAEAVPAYGVDWAESGQGGLLAAAMARHLLPAPPGTSCPGDVLLFRLRPRGPVRHLGVQVTGCANGGHFVHAYSGHGVVESALTQPWRRRLVARFRFPPV